MNKTVLAIGGSDCSGGAGIQADIAAIRSNDCYPVTAVSCVTSQGAGGFRMMQTVSLKVFTDQLETLIEDCNIDAVKLGMLPTPTHVERVLKLLPKLKNKPIVVDPVMVPSNGNTGDCQEAWRNADFLSELGKYKTLLTPNIPEAFKLMYPNEDGEDFYNSKFGFIDYFVREYGIEMIYCDLAEKYHIPYILLKGGHLRELSREYDAFYRKDMAQHYDKWYADILEESMQEKDVIIDYIYLEGKNARLTHNIINTHNTHGTGCTLASAIAANLANGKLMINAIRNGVQYLQDMLLLNEYVSFYKKNPKKYTDPKGPVQYETTTFIEEG